MNVLLLNPPFKGRFSRASRSPGVSKGGTLYYPIWLAYSAGVLEAAGCQIRLIDAPASGLRLSDVINNLKDFIPQMIVMDTSTPSIASDISRGGVCAILGNMVKRKDILLVELNSKSKEKLTTLTEVAWIKPSGTCRGNFCGLRFLWVSSERLLEECINHAGMRSAA